MHYSDVSALSFVYLEDSYVLNIAEAPRELRFRLDAVLSEQHPAYRPPKPGGQYCYASGWLVLPNVTLTEWEHRSTQRYIDAVGEEDLGNIDFLERREDHWWIGGDWGNVRVYTSANPEFILDNTAPS